ncbi:Beta-glucan synthesis-associated protein SKN1 [Saccharomyces cerevisiae S288c] [Rhizoctonia solani]|uniref:Beta-glucan synthesis-associated protein SKN1 [Saccharomyces cerevisiae S288c] n=1 Tax=Rhizoctonia solani TaxID=456999 RepID=A0A0K6GDS9_9AGAM|nr:Beta-glucan synthesis-associated protein SKN1 [Saccharomyces cerevisiae S288c] [Rhizoctonia solani]
MVDNEPEPDDDLHNPDPNRDRRLDHRGSFSARGLANVGCLVLLLAAVILLFAGYPIIAYMTESPMSTLGGYNLGGINASGQVPEIPGLPGLIDRDTPKSAYTRTSHVDGTTYDLVFSDEFDVEGRSFYPGDDPYWEAVDMHYWVTNNIEWYDPAQIKTVNGSLYIELAKKDNHNMNYTGGMLTSWNKFCFTEGYIEAKISLPGASNIYGLWPAFWLMGNLGRAGYGASLEGNWPYTYDTCDVGTLANQTDPATNLPAAAHVGGTPGAKGEMSYLGGQRLSACTCTSESDGTDGRQMVHPGPKKADGSYVGRGAPEIDIFEATVDTRTLIGHVSQSGQWAPFNAAFRWDNETNLVIYDHEKSHLNTFIGNERQQTTSVITNTNQQCYTGSGGCFQAYAVEYKTGGDGYIQWVTDDSPVFMVKAAGLGPDPLTEIGPRPIPPEPMYILLNLGMSYNFGAIDLEHLGFPVHMLVDYVRVYQPSGKRNIGCDPKDYPTADYINTYIEAYTNNNLTTWVDDYKQRVPKNRLIDQC